jgi:hypothetical protein
VSKQIQKIFSNWQLGMTYYMKLLIIIGLRLVTISTAKDVIAKRKMFPITILTDSR